MVAIDCVGSVKPGGTSARVPGTAAAPPAVGDSDTVNVFGDPLNCRAFSYAIRIGWSYIRPVLARTTVRGFSVQATPARGPRLFLSALNCWLPANGALATPGGGL